MAFRRDTKSSSEVVLMIKIGLGGSDVTPAYRHGFMAGVIPSDDQERRGCRLPRLITLSDQEGLGSTLKCGMQARVPEAHH